MPNFTSNFGLTKPFVDEFYDVNVQNENMDKIDVEMEKLTHCVVNIKYYDGVGRYSTDKSYEEIVAAHESGKLIFGILNDNEVLPICIIGDTQIGNSIYPAVRLATIANYNNGSLVYVCYNILSNNSLVRTEGLVPTYNCGTADYVAGTTPLADGKLYFVYE